MIIIVHPGNKLGADPKLSLGWRDKHSISVDPAAALEVTQKSSRRPRQSKGAECYLVQGQTSTRLSRVYTLLTLQSLYERKQLPLGSRKPNPRHSLKQVASPGAEKCACESPRRSRAARLSCWRDVGERDARGRLRGIKIK
jgi:hypothetical protein